MPSAEEGERRFFLVSRQGLVLVGFLAIAGYFLWTEHEAHVRALFPFWPWLLLLACPLMHVFMHSGHDHGGHGGSREPHNGEER